jgi:hypothetical protein
MKHSRHTYASDMLRAGVGLPALMKLLGHTNPEMTMRYLEVVLIDLQREFQLARSSPRQPRSTAENIICTSWHCSQWGNRFPDRCATCAGNVPLRPLKRQYTRLPRPAL